MSKSTKPSNRRYRAMLQDVGKRVWYAFASGDHTNPYELEDKRHERFQRKLGHTIRTDLDFIDICEAYGMDTTTMIKRIHPHPGPVLPIAELI